MTTSCNQPLTYMKTPPLTQKFTLKTVYPKSGPFVMITRTIWEIMSGNGKTFSVITATTS